MSVGAQHCECCGCVRRTPTKRIRMLPCGRRPSSN
jgi:hypothetical protein